MTSADLSARSSTAAPSATTGISRKEIAVSTPGANFPRSTITMMKTGRIRYNHRVSTAEDNHIVPPLCGPTTALIASPRHHTQLAEISPNASGATIATTGITHWGAAESALGAIIGTNIMTEITAGKTIITHFMLETMNNAKKLRGRV